QFEFRDAAVDSNNTSVVYGQIPEIYFKINDVVEINKMTSQSEVDKTDHDEHQLDARTGRNTQQDNGISIQEYATTLTVVFENVLLRYENQSV
ncbi:hypothetical protein PMAYCL1PPCAC_32189, partial [Pristionchus mayeri]